MTLGAITPTGAPPERALFPYGTPEDVQRATETLGNIEPTGTFSMMWTAYRHSIGQASNKDLAMSTALWGVNFVPFGKGGKVAKEGAEEGFTRLFRAVGQEELDDIVKSGVRVNPDGTGYRGVKLFAETADDAVWFGRNNHKLHGTSSHIISVDVPNSVISNSYRGSDLSTRFISVPAEELNRVQNVRVFTFSPYRRSQ